MDAMLKARCEPYSVASKNDEVMEAITWFVQEALPAVNSNWSRDLTRQNEFMTKVVTRTDEAFVLWTISTSKENWLQQAEQGGKLKVNEGDMDEEDEKGSSRFGSEAGLELYEHFVKEVENTRLSQCCEDWDRQIQCQIRDCLKNNTIRMEKPKRCKKRKYEKNFDMQVDLF